MAALERVEAALEAHGCRRGDKTATGRMWTCPCHDDRTPSLHVSNGDGRVLLHCHAGCEADAVRGAIGLAWRDLGPERADADESVFEYRDEHGARLFEVVRFAGKRFAQRRPGARSWGIAGVRRVLYRLPELRAACDRGERVWVVEGEKDADRLASMGLVATTSPGGAGSWRDGYGDQLVGASEVVVVADRDDPGVGHARQIAASCAARSIPCRILQAALDRPGADVSDHLDAGHDLDELVPLAEGWGADDGRPSNAEREAAGPSPRIEVVDLAAMLAEPPPPLDRLLAGFFERGEFAAIVGPGGAGKSVFALSCGLHVVNPEVRAFVGVPVGDVERLVYIDAENPRKTIARRLHAFAPPPGLLPRITYARASGLDLSTRAGRDELRGIIGEGSLVILDSARGLHRADEDDSAEVRPLLDAVRRMAEDAGATPWLLTHTPHGVLRPRGSTDWTNAVDDWAGFTYDKDSGVRTLALGKVRDGSDEGELALRYVSRAGVLCVEAADATGPTQESTKGVGDVLTERAVSALRIAPNMQRAEFARAQGRATSDGTLRSAWERAKQQLADEVAEVATGSTLQARGGGPVGTPPAAATPLHLATDPEPRWRGDPDDPTGWGSDR